MTRARTPGITFDRNGRAIIDKEHRGVRIYVRLGRTTQEEAQRRLGVAMQRVQSELEWKANARMRFADGAARYLEESRDRRTVDVTAWHVRLLTPYIGTLELNRIHDRTLERFVADRIAEGVSATTVNRSLEVVRTVLNRAARSYRDDEGHPWLEGMPALITMLPETRRPPYPITWEEQDPLFPKLPARLARMVLFAVNTGLRESNVCRLEWAWEVRVPEVARSAERLVAAVKLFQEESRTRRLTADEVRAFFGALETDPSEAFRDFLTVLLFTGARRINVLAMRWDEIDLEARTWEIPAAKAKAGKAILLPLAAGALDVLRRRAKEREGKPPEDRLPFVFPAASASGHMEAPKKQWAAFRVRAGIADVRLHDVRRTLGSFMVNTGASLAIVGKQLGHRDAKSTARYAHLELAPVRDALDRAEQALRQAAQPAAEVIPMPTGKPRPAREGKR